LPHRLFGRGTDSRTSGDGVQKHLYRIHVQAPVGTYDLDKMLAHLREALLPLRARETLVLDPVWLVGVDAEAALLVGFVVLEVAFEPFDMAVAFERQHVRRHAVEEP